MLRRCPRQQAGFHYTALFTSLAMLLVLAVQPAQAGRADAVRADPRKPVITVAAAASLTDVIGALADVFRQRSGIAVRTSFSSSAVAARQVIGGAPFDVLISANTAWITHTLQQGAGEPTSRRVIAGNRLVIAVAGNMAPEIDRDSDAGGLIEQAIINGWRIAIADPASVPAGRYAVQALAELGLIHDARPLFVPLQNVRAATAYVQRGETPLGFTYQTDLRLAPTLAAVAVDPSLHPPVTYAAVRILNGSNPEGSTAFLRFLGSAEAQRIFAIHGFLPPPGEHS